MEKMRMESINLTEKSIEKIGALFPSVITEAKGENGNLRKAINFALLKQLLSEDVVDGEEAYEFTWVGKKESMVEAGKPIRKTLRPCYEESKDWDKTENLYIEGDNLDVLKLLQESYLGAVKLIYIDPPYNTGSDFIYRDKFYVSNDDFNENAGLIDEDENRLFQNNWSNGRFHSDWCSMINSRLLLAKNLLSDDGTIFISIDENEVAQLRKICDEVFGEHNYISEFVWQKKTGASDSVNIATITEYILVYAKKVEQVKFNQNTSAFDENRYKYKDIYFEERGPFYYDNLDRGTLGYHESLDYAVTTPDGKITFPNGRTKQYNDGWRWKWSKEKLLWGIENGYVEVREASSKESGWGVYYKIYLNVDNEGKPIIRSSPYKNLIQGVLNTHASNEAKEIFDRTGLFSNPKPVELIKILQTIAMGKNDIMMDFFSGSSTSAHSLMKLNAEDNGNRKFIMVQLPEICDEKTDAFKAGYSNICEIGKERIRRSGEKIKEESGMLAQDLDIGFRVLKLDSTNMKDVYYAADQYSQGMLAGLESNIKEDRTDLDLLFGCLLEWGLPLSLPHVSEEIDGVQVHTINDGDLMACFAQNISEAVVKEIAKRQPLRAVFRDNSFANSPEKINVEEIFKLMAPNTSVKVL